MIQKNHIRETNRRITLWIAKKKTRVYELAKELNCSVKDMMTALGKLDIKVGSHMSSLNENEINKIINSRLVFENYLITDDFMKTWKKAGEKLNRSTQQYLHKLSKIKVVPDPETKVLGNKRIEILEGETGHTYESLFGDYLRNAKRIELIDKWIRKDHQIRNLVRFCRMLEKMGNIENIQLVTGFDNDENKKCIVQKFEDLKESLGKYKILFSYNFDNKIHDRKITTDDGWLIDLGKGLDIYKPPTSWYKIESEDFEYRECFQTTININKKKD